MASEPQKDAPPAEATEPEKAARPPATTPPTNYFAVADVVLRLLVFASAVVSVVVMSTSKQTEIVPTPVPPYQEPRSAKFNHSPALIYFVAALSVAGFFSIITSLGSLYSLTKPAGCSAKIISHFIVIDVLLLGIVASATGAAASVAYIGLKGNTHTGWGKVCSLYGKFCRYLGASIGVSLLATIMLVLLVLLSVYSISKKIPK